MPCGSVLTRRACLATRRFDQTCRVLRLVAQLDRYRTPGPATETLVGEFTGKLVYDARPRDGIVVGGQPQTRSDWRVNLPLEAARTPDPVDATILGVLAEDVIDVMDNDVPRRFVVIDTDGARSGASFLTVFVRLER